MISPVRPSPHARRPFQPSPASAIAVPEQDPYGRPFWLAYASNFLISLGVAVLIRYGDFITLLGGSELHLGWIVGVGMVGSLVMRLAMGMGIDRHGPRLVWLGSLALFAVMVLAHLGVTSPTGLPIYLLRVGYCCAVAGIYGASMTFVSSRVPLERTAELVGIIGTSAFLGNIAGTQLGDLLRGSGVLERPQMDRMFVAAALFAILAMPVSWLAMRGHAHARPVSHPPVGRLLRQYHPGVVMPVIVAMGAVLYLPYTFLPTYAAELKIPRIAWFFTLYAISAVITRVVTRRWPQQMGLRNMILLGSTGMALSLLAFLWATSEWLLVLPGIGYGMSHAVLFPATVAAGSARFPVEHRGLAMTLVLALWDTGQLVGMPLAGALVHYTEAAGLPPYPTLFLTMACVVGAVAAGYAIWTRGSRELAASGPAKPPVAPTKRRRRPRKAPRRLA